MPINRTTTTRGTAYTALHIHINISHRTRRHHVTNTKAAHIKSHFNTPKYQRHSNAHHTTPPINTHRIRMTSPPLNCIVHEIHQHDVNQVPGRYVHTRYFTCITSRQPPTRINIANEAHDKYGNSSYCCVFSMWYKVPPRDVGTVESRGRREAKRGSQVAQLYCSCSWPKRHPWVSVLLKEKSNSSQQEPSTIFSVVNTTLLLLHARDTMG